MKLKLIHSINSRDFIIKKITNLSQRERLSTIFETDLPFVLSFDYKNPHNETEMMPIFSSNGTHFAFRDTIKMNETIELRLSEKDCQYHMNSILEKQKLYNQFIESQNIKILEDFKKLKLK